MCGCEVADGLIAPIISEPVADQGMVVHELVHRHQLDRGDTEALQVVDYGRVGQPGIGAPQLGWYLRMTPRQAADMDLVDDRIGVRDPAGADRLPSRRQGRPPPIASCAARCPSCWAATRRNRACIRIRRVVPADGAVHCLGVRIQEQLVGIARLALDRIPRPVDPVAVMLPWPNTGHITMPDE